MNEYICPKIFEYLNIFEYLSHTVVVGRIGYLADIQVFKKMGLGMRFFHYTTDIQFTYKYTKIVCVAP